MDYLPLDMELTFAPDDTEKTVTLALLNDVVLEAEEQFTATLSVPGTASGITLTSPSSLTINVADDDSEWVDT